MTLDRHKRVTAADASRNFAEFNERALKEPVIVTRNGKASTVLMSVEAFERLLANDRAVFLAKHPPRSFDAKLDAIARGISLQQASTRPPRIAELIDGVDVGSSPVRRGLPLIITLAPRSLARPH